MEPTVDLAVYPDAALDQLTGKQLRESLSHFKPDVIVVEQPYHEPRFTTQDTDAELAHLNNWSTILVTDGPGPQIACISTPDDFEMLREHEQLGNINTETETFVLSSELSVDIDLTNLETSLEGREAYVDAITAATLDGSYTHLTVNANPAYRNDWDGLVVQGVFPGASETDVTPSTEIAKLSLHSDGTVASDTYEPGRFGLAGLDEVGPTHSDTLHEAGLTTKAAVADSSLSELQQLDGIGPKNGKQILYSAKARENGTAYRTSSESLPGNDPVFIDIETDGLSPTMIWLIGVYDTRTDRYMSFTATNPVEKGKAVEAFMMWYTGNATGRPIVAYNGEKFDFPHLHDHINQHCPEYSDAWKDAWTFDLLWWASTQGNAVLPGLTNKLEDVAEALGWETDDTGLSGAVVGQRFQQWLANPCDETELDWERHETYCEDDVRALAYVFEAVQKAEPIEGVASSDGPRDSEQTTTTQGTFSDF